MSKFYLARNQQVFGPLAGDEVQAMRQSGQLAGYTWLWKEGDDAWSPIDPPPALPTASTRPSLHLVPEVDLETGAASQVPVETIPRPRPHLVAQETFRVILFDHRSAISGWLISATEGGCEIRSDQNGPKSSDPLFVQKGAACLTLHDTRSGDTVKLNVRVSLVSRSRGGWSYRLRWGAAPALLSGSGRSERAVAA